MSLYIEEEGSVTLPFDTEEIAPDRESGDP